MASGELTGLYAYKYFGRFLSKFTGISPKSTAARALAVNQLYIEANGAFEQVGAQLLVDMTSIVNQGFSQELSERMSLFAQAMGKRMNQKAYLLGVHRSIAEQAQTAILGAYEKARVGSPAPYRTNERYAGGKLRDALGDSSFIIPRSDGILFFNTGLLDRKAKQWYRLNYGAGTAGNLGPQAQDFPLRFEGGVSGASLSLRQFGPSAPFRMPLGFFFSNGDPSSSLSTFLSGGGGLVKPAYGGTRHPFSGPLRQIPSALSGKALTKQLRGFLAAGIPVTHGIRAEHWLDAGLRSVQQSLPRAYEDVAKKWFKEAMEQGRGPIASAGLIRR